MRATGGRAASAARAFTVGASSVNAASPAFQVPSGWRVSATASSALAGVTVTVANLAGSSASSALSSRSMAATSRSCGNPASVKTAGFGSPSSLAKRVPSGDALPTITVRGLASAVNVTRAVGLSRP